METQTRPLRRRLFGLIASVAAILGLSLAFTQGANAAEIDNFTAGFSSTQAGAYADQNVDISFQTEEGTVPPGGPFDPCATMTGECMVVVGGAAKDIVVDLPEGFVGNVGGIEQCTHQELVGLGCSIGSQVGVIDPLMVIGLGLEGPMPRVGLFNMVRNKGEVARLGFQISGVVGYISLKLSDGARPHLTATAGNIATHYPLVRSNMKLFGVPGVRSNDPDRVCYPRNDQFNCFTTPSFNPPAPFLANGAECGVDHSFSLAVNTYQDPAGWNNATSTPFQLTGCEEQTFRPRMQVRTTENRSGSPSGVEFEFGIPQTWHNPDGVATPPLKDAVVTLPEGMSMSPSSVDGLGACSDADLKMGKNSERATCPHSSKIGNIELVSPLLPDLFRGGVYLRPQNSSDPASGEMFRIAMEIANEDRGVHLKLPGQIALDPKTGQITTRFLENPQLPFENLKLRLKAGARAPLSLPDTCGTHRVDAELTAWGLESRPVNLRPAFEVTENCQPQGFKPELQAGSMNPQGGEHSPFAMRVTRGDRQEQLTRLDVALPEGLTGKLAGIPYCSETALAKFAGKTNTTPGTAKDELANPSCPAASEVGRVVVGAGPGSLPYYLQTGKAYLAGPYEGAPLSLATIVPVKAGPFDLGTVMVRNALEVDKTTAQITVRSDQIPTRLEGIPLNIRDLRVEIDRDQFMLNPTDCSPTKVWANVRGTSSSSANLDNHFQAADCAALGFAPRFGMQILNRNRRSTLRSFNPATRYVVAPRPGDANIAGAAVTLPSGVILDQSNIGTTCTRDQLATRTCPERSRLGFARAWSPLLDRPVQGPVYLGSSDNPLPDLVADLQGQVDVQLRGRIVGTKQGQIRNVFDVVPDVAVSRFVMSLAGGKNRGILVNSTDLCRTNTRGAAVFHGQNGKRQVTRPALRLGYRGCKQVRRGVARQQAVRRAAIRKALAGGKITPTQARRAVRR